MNKMLFGLVPVLLISYGCATPYQELGEAGGYLQKKLTEDTYQVTFHGNGYTNRPRVRDFALLRAAEIGRQLGYAYLTVEGEEDCSRTSIANMGSTSHTTGTVYPSGFYTGTTTSYEPDVPVVKPGVILQVRYYEGEPAGRHLESYRVDDAINTIRAKYKLR
ncbi:MAG: hypothetical protein ACE15C_00795 [Phycisphaerae bacterium]